VGKTPMISTNRRHSALNRQRAQRQHNELQTLPRNERRPTGSKSLTSRATRTVLVVWRPVQAPGSCSDQRPPGGSVDVNRGLHGLSAIRLRWPSSSDSPSKGHLSPRTPFQVTVARRGSAQVDSQMRLSARHSPRVPLLPALSSPAGKGAGRGSLVQHLAQRGRSVAKWSQPP